MADRLLIFGGTGLLGTELSNHFRSDYETISLGSKEADIRNSEQVNKVLQKHKPDIVFNSAALANVDQCEKNRQLAYDINVTGAENLALKCRELNITLVHFSTDYIFDGRKNVPYLESDKPNPINYYGMTKMLAEKIINDVGGRFIILRVAWIYAQNDRSFVYKLIQDGVNQLVTKGHGGDFKPMSIVADQIGNPTFAGDIARQVGKIIDSGLTGTFHCTAEGESSRFDLARIIFDELEMPVEITPIKAEKFKWNAPRPLYTALENQALAKAGLNIMPPYQDSIRKFINSMELS